MNENSPLLVLSHVHKSFSIAGKKTSVLVDVSFEIKEGEWVSIMGPSGSGKTTLLSLIAGLLRPDKGKVIWRGKQLFYFFDILPAYLRNRDIGFVFQEFWLVEDQSVWENLLLPLRIRGWYGKKELHHAEWLLENVGLSAYKKQKAALLSGGQKQRLSLARALIQKPSLLLADEPFANLDEKTSREMFDLFSSIHKHQPFSMILVHHRKKLIKHCHRTYYLHKGRLELV